MGLYFLNIQLKRGLQGSHNCQNYLLSIQIYFDLVKSLIK